MIDIRFVRENPDVVRESQRRRNDESTVDALLAADDSRRAALQAFEAKRAEQKDMSRSVGKASPEERPAILAKAKELSEQVKELEAEANAADAAYEQANLAIQNIVLDGFPQVERTISWSSATSVKRAISRPKTSDKKDHLDRSNGGSPSS